MDLFQGTVQYNKPIVDDTQIKISLCVMAIKLLARIPCAPLSKAMQNHWQYYFLKKCIKYIVYKTYKLNIPS